MWRLQGAAQLLRAAAQAKNGQRRLDGQHPPTTLGEVAGEMMFAEACGPIPRRTVQQYHFGLLKQPRQPRDRWRASPQADAPARSTPRLSLGRPDPCARTAPDRQAARGWR